MVFFNTIMRISKLYQKVIKFMVADLIFLKYFLENVFPLLSWWRYIFICLAVGLHMLDVVAAPIW